MQQLMYFLNPATNGKFEPVNVNVKIRYYSHVASMWPQDLWCRVHCLKKVPWLVLFTWRVLVRDEQVVYCAE